MKKEMLINVLQPEECRIAIVEDGVLEELYVERTSLESFTGNIYKGKIVNLEPAIQAAFVDFSVGRNGFLHVSDVEPQYYKRLLGEDSVLGARDKGREPRDHDRDEPRPSRSEERAPRSSLPPQLEDRPRERGRDRGRERDRDRDREERDRDQDRGERERPDLSEKRERPDLSEKGRRDRSESRPFGEGLVEEEWRPPAKSHERHRAVEPPPPPPPRVEEPPAPRIEREPERERERQPEITFPTEPEEPRGRLPRPIEPIESYLPPSRTHRARTGPMPPEEPEGLGPPEPLRPYREAPPEPEARVSEPRRGRGRGRPARPAPDMEVPAEPEPIEERPEPELPSGDLPEPPRRRGGRAAIRSRGGDRERGREREPRREREREPEREPEERPIPYVEPPAAERSRGMTAELPFGEGIERPSTAEPEPRPRGRGRGTERGRAGESETPRERKPPHGRAGEPGYVPRRERTRHPETEPPFDWGDLAAMRDLEAAEELGADPEAKASESEKGDAGRRRRRRRGRRRERPDREGGAATSPIDEADFDEELGRYAPASSRAAEDFDLEEDVEDEDEAAGLIHEERAALEPEEEIDPELEEEIRREIDEIMELEREMGLRGTTEARPRRGEDREAEPRGRGGRVRGLAKPPIQEVFRRGDEVLVQVIKESIGTKGPTLSTYISIPGRYLVLMPGLNRVGVSRKIADEVQRRRLRSIMNELNPPKGLGFIVRTAGLERSKRELARDLAYLLRLWKVILRRIKKAKAPAPIYQESDMITRTIRDIFTEEIDTIWIDEPQAFERAQEFLRVVMPRFVNRLKFYDDKVPLFHKYGLEEEIAKIQRRRVDLPEGGSIVIDQTEALVAIDVNSGNFRVEDDAERTAYEMNLRAAKEIARQLRLRDLGGVICNDFIDMRDERNRRGVERALREAVRRDRARTKILRMSQFGIIEMTRQRIRPSLRRSIYEDCGHCHGAGVVKTAESVSIDVMRLLALAAHRAEIRRVSVSVSGPVANYLSNRKRREVARLESEANMTILIRHQEDAPAEHLQIDCFDAQNNEIRLLPAPPPPPRRGR